ncbi:hypothetical protein ACH4TV_45545 [Streptomyces sp. NPDC020898]|uniref:hypothetical protein n=1 Tax=Streptomyces sp. NPDC020898 TaxID=3365101 RepID=UPI0037A49FF2
MLQHARNLGEMQLGITLYDSGHLNQADCLVTATCVETRRSGMIRSEIAAETAAGPE